MGYSKLFNLLDKDIKSKSFISNLASGYMEVPFLIEETLKLLDDNSPYYNIISDNNKKSLCIMMDQYFNDCWELYIEDLKLDKLLQFGKIEVYKIDAVNGLRYATVNEVAQGTKGLIGENIYPAGQKEYEYLSLLQWTFTGISYYFRQAGYSLNYDKDGKVTNGTYEMIQMCALKLKEMYEWISDKDKLNKAINRISKMKKSNGYKYATYEKDEIVEDISIKQLVYNIYKVFPRNSTNNDYRKALALALKAYKNNQKLTPLEIAYLREVYDAHALDTNRAKQKDNNTDEELKKKCELLIAERYNGSINQKHFVYNIIETLKKYNYSRCSPKQFEIIEDALKTINGNVPDLSGVQSNNNTEVISDTEIDLSLASLSNAIGDGLFEDE